MKQTRHAVVMVGMFLGLSSFLVQAKDVSAEELRHAQKIMQARAGWMKAMGGNLAAEKYDSVKNDAEALAGQTKGAVEKQTDPLAKELTLKISTLATGLAGAAEAKDASSIAAKLGEIKAVCAECHAKIRDKQ